MAAPIFFVTPMRSPGSRVDIAQKPNKSGQILDQRLKIFFVIFTKLIPRRIFFCLAKILVLMVSRVLKVIWGLRAESSKGSVAREVRNTGVGP